MIPVTFRVLDTRNSKFAERAEEFRKATIAVDEARRLGGVFTYMKHGVDLIWYVTFNDEESAAVWKLSQ